MKKIFKIIFIFVISFVVIPRVYAEGCSDSDFNKYSKLASMIKFEIKYIGKQFEDEYGIYISGLSDGFIVENNGKYYDNNSLIEGLKAKETYLVKVYNNKDLMCSYKLNYKRNIKMPAYNRFHNSEYCSDKDISYCNVTYDSSRLTEEKFKALIDEYLDKQNEVVVVEENNNIMLYCIIGGAVLLVVIVLVIILSKRKKRVL